MMRVRALEESESVDFKVVDNEADESCLVVALLIPMQ